MVLSVVDAPYFGYSDRRISLSHFRLNAANYWPSACTKTRDHTRRVSETGPLGPALTRLPHCSLCRNMVEAGDAANQDERELIDEFCASAKTVRKYGTAPFATSLFWLTAAVGRCGSKYAGVPALTTIGTFISHTQVSLPICGLAIAVSA